VDTGAGEVLPATELRLEGTGLPRPVRGRRPDTGVPDLLLYRFDNLRCRRLPSGPREVPAGYVEGAPGLVVEVRSPGTEDYDLSEKCEAFARAGVATTGCWIGLPGRRWSSPSQSTAPTDRKRSWAGLTCAGRWRVRRTAGGGATRPGSRHHGRHTATGVPTPA
jgi:hypothetical protein